jgi:predicted LPLAT superfamily acyltransferase
MTGWYHHRYHTLLSHRIVFAVIPRLPRVLHPPVAVVTAALFFLLLRDERRSVVRNLRTIRGRGGLGTAWSAFRVFYTFCDFIVSYCYVPRADAATLEAMLSDADRGARVIDECLSGGSGLVVWTAHVGNWEFASRLLELSGRPVNVARLVEAGNPAEAMLRDLMVNPNLRIVDLNDPLASIQLLCALRRNEIVAMQGDRVYQTGSVVELPFFGRPARFPPGPFHLANVSGAPLLPGLVVRTGWLRYRVVMGEPISVDRTLDRDEWVRLALARAVAFLEGQLRRWHHQWLNFYDFWEPRDTRGELGRAHGPRASAVDRKWTDVSLSQ